MSDQYNEPPAMEEPWEEEEEEEESLDEIDEIWEILDGVSAKCKEDKEAILGRLGNLEHKQGDLEENQVKLTGRVDGVEENMQKHREETKESQKAFEQHMEQRFEAFVLATPVLQASTQLQSIPVVPRTGRRAGTPMARTVLVEAGPEAAAGPIWKGPFLVNGITPCKACLRKGNEGTGRCSQYKHDQLP